MTSYPSKLHPGKSITDPTAHAVDVLARERRRLRRLLSREPAAPEARLLPCLARNLARFTGRQARERGGRA